MKMGKTPSRQPFVQDTDVAEKVFSKCVTTNEGKRNWCGKEVYPDSPDFKVVFNYEFLEDYLSKHSSDMEDPPDQGSALFSSSTLSSSSTVSSSSAESWRPKKFTKYNHPLYLIKKCSGSRLLRHPLVTSLLECKWNNYGRYIFFGNLFLYVVFLTFLTAFSLVVLSPVERTCVDIFMASFNGTAPETCEGLSLPEYRFLYISAVVTILTALLRLAMEIAILLRHPLEYLLDWVNWWRILVYPLSIVFTIVFATPCLCVPSWQWQVGVVAVFLGWSELIVFLQKWPLTGVYVLMFVNIVESFLKIACLALLLVIAFALPFYMLLFEPDEMRNAFSHPGRAILKVMAMTTGELDYDELYHQQEGEQEIAFPPVSFILWIIFLVLMPVLLSNLLVGLAVGEVDRLKQTMSENRLELQVNLILSLEELLEVLHIRHRFVTDQHERYPNNNWYDVFVNSLPDRYGDGPVEVRRTTGQKIFEAIKPPPDSIEEQMHRQSEKLEARLKEEFQEAVKQLSESHKEQAKEQTMKAELLADEVASLRETLHELITQVTAK